VHMAMLHAHAVAGGGRAGHYAIEGERGRDCRQGRWQETGNGHGKTRQAAFPVLISLSVSTAIRQAFFLVSGSPGLRRWKVMQSGAE